MKTNKCRKAKKANNFIDIGFNHILPSKKGAIIFGSCPGLGNTTFCWSKITSKKNKTAIVIFNVAAALFIKLQVAIPEYKVKKPQSKTDKPQYIQATGGDESIVHDKCGTPECCQRCEPSKATREKLN